jgi:hypothetical protein
MTSSAKTRDLSHGGSGAREDEEEGDARRDCLVPLADTVQIGPLGL